MTADSHNNVQGRTLNPYNLSFTAGGSTGGEGALIAMRGSVLGMATDIAGSCRIPALCCGLKSFKPSAGRVPFGGGVPPGRLGSPSAILAVIGPIGWSIRDSSLVMRTICNGNAWALDEGVLNVPWRQVDPVTRPLRIGLVRGHPKRPLHPPIARALHSAATKLKENGHQIILIEDKVPDLWECALLAFKFFKLDPKKTPSEILKASGEPPIPSLVTATFRELDGWEPTLDRLFDMNVERAKILKRYHDIFIELDLDAVMMPGYQATAVPHDTYGIVPYTVMQNLLNVSVYLQACLPTLINRSIHLVSFRI
jgi:amidase